MKEELWRHCEFLALFAQEEKDCDMEFYQCSRHKCEHPELGCPCDNVENMTNAQNEFEKLAIKREKIVVRFHSAVAFLSGILVFAIFLWLGVSFYISIGTGMLVSAVLDAYFWVMKHSEDD